MTAVEITAVCLGWTAAAVATAALIATRRQAVRNQRERDRTFPWKGGEVAVTAPMAEADFEAFKARWQERYGRQDSCTAYQPPTTPADSGLCVRCGMYDYKHQEVTGA